MALTPKMVTIDCVDPQALARFWTEAAGYRTLRDFPGFVMLVPADDREGIALGLQQVPETRVGKNRVHLDWHSEDRVTEVERLVKLGATPVREESVPGLTWTVLTDPEGNEFCVGG